MWYLQPTMQNQRTLLRVTTNNMLNLTLKQFPEVYFIIKNRIGQDFYVNKTTNIFD